MEKRSLKIVGRENSLELSLKPAEGGYQLNLGGQTLEARHTVKDQNTGWLRVDGQVIPYHVWKSQDQVQVWLKGTIYRFEIPQPAGRQGGDSAAAHSGDIKSPMPGKILKVKAKEGDTVEAGEALVIMESMKMEMTLSAPKAGRVVKVQCEEGQMVDMGAVLVKLEEVAAEGVSPANEAVASKPG